MDSAVDGWQPRRRRGPPDRRQAWHDRGSATANGVQVAWGRCLEALSDARSADSPMRSRFTRTSSRRRCRRIWVPTPVRLSGSAPSCPRWSRRSLRPSFGRRRERLRLREAVASWLRMSQRRPLLVVIDDAQHAGPISRRCSPIPQRATRESDPRCGTVPALAGVAKSIGVGPLDEVRPPRPGEAAGGQSPQTWRALFTKEAAATPVRAHLSTLGCRGAIPPMPTTMPTRKPPALPLLRCPPALSTSWLAAYLSGDARQLSIDCVFAGAPHSSWQPPWEPRVLAPCCCWSWGRDGLTQSRFRSRRLPDRPAGVANAVLVSRPRRRGLACIGGSRPPSRTLSVTVSARAPGAGPSLRPIGNAGWEERGLNPVLLAAEQARAAYAHRRVVACFKVALALASDRDRSLRTDLLGRLAGSEAAAGLIKDAITSAHSLLETIPVGAAVPDEVYAGVIDTLRALRGDGLSDAELSSFEGLRGFALERAALADSLVRARLGSWRALDGQQGGRRHHARLGQAPARSGGHAVERRHRSDARGDAFQRARTQAQTGRAAELARAWRRPPSVLRALRASSPTSCGATDCSARATQAAEYETTARRYGAHRDKVARSSSKRGHAALGSLPPQTRPGRGN